MVFADSQPSRRAPVRMETQDGPWTVSVAESPHDAHSYSLYIKTPTHNLTLTRTAMEIVELDQKLRESNLNAVIPPLPLEPPTLPSPKRKSNFLNTLTRLASPSASKTARNGAAPRTSNVPGSPTSSSPMTTPHTSPSKDSSDAFSSFSNGDDAPMSPASMTVPLSPPPGASSTSIAAYLTTISNNAAVRQARIWKRFVHVRTDDLMSARAERAIKRVRSDLAAHGGMSKDREGDETDDGDVDPAETATVTTAATLPAGGEDGVAAQRNGHTGDGDESIDGINEEGDDDGDSPINRRSTSRPASILKAERVNVNGGVEGNEGIATSRPTTAADGKSEDPTVNGIQWSSASVDTKTIDTVHAEPEPQSATTEEAPTTPIQLQTPVTPAEAHSNRIHRSKSADPDKSTRLTRAFVDSAVTPDGSQTGDESSVNGGNGSGSPTAENTRRRQKKKRSMSTDPSKELGSPHVKKKTRKVAVDDFEMMRVLGKGCAGKVLLVRYKHSGELYALKAITKRHVLAHQELQHTLTEQAVLKRMAADQKDPFVVRLWWSFHDKENLFLVMDFHPGGDLATQLARWGRLGRDRARFYAAEIVEGVEGLHAAGVIYRDLKPENILIGADGHIVLTDFGLSKEFPRRRDTVTAPSTPSGSRTGIYPPWMKVETGGELSIGWPGQPMGQLDTTATFCGTAEYLAPEVIQGLAYSYEVDWWSFGTMLYEMLTGITPFWANNHSDMYVRVLQDELQFPDDRAIDQDTKSLIRGLLQRNPALRMCEPRIKRHPYFSMIDWSHVYYKRYIPPYIPPIDPSNASDTQNFDETFLDMEPVLDDATDEQTDTDQEQEQTDTDKTDGEDYNTTPSQSRSSSVRPAKSAQPEDESVDVFDGYSYKARNSVYIEEEEEGEGGTDGTDETGSEEITDEDNVSEEVGETENVPADGVLPSPATESVKADKDEIATPVEVKQEEGPKTPGARPSNLPPVEPPQPVIEVQEPKPKPKPTPAPEVVKVKPPSPDKVTKPKHVTLEEPPATVIVETPEPAKVEPEEVKLEVKPEPKPEVKPEPKPEVKQEAKPEPKPEVKQEPKPEPKPEVTAPPPQPEPVVPAPVVKELPKPEPAPVEPPSVPEKEPKARPPPLPAKAAVPSHPASKHVKRREKSGVVALDRYLADQPDETDIAEREDDEDDDWDFIDAVDGEDRNGPRGGPSLFARGVVDKYRLAVFRKSSTPSRNNQSRNVSGVSKGSEASDVVASPSSKSERRGRTPGLPFRKTPKQFLQPKSPKSPPSSFSSKTSVTPKSALRNGTTSTATSTAGDTLSPSLKSKESAVSVGAKSHSSGQSNDIDMSFGSNGLNLQLLAPSEASMAVASKSTVHIEEPEKAKTKKLKRYKENAEKVFSLFSSPRERPS